MRRKYAQLSMLCLTLTLLSACASSGQRQQLEMTGFLKGSLSCTINQRAVDYHKDNLVWPDAQYLSKYSGLPTHNRIYGTNFSIYKIDKPYQDIPADLDKSQTFVFNAYYSPVDSSRHVSCQIYYNDRKHCFTNSSSDGEEASIWAMAMEVEKHFIDFLAQARLTTDQAEINNLAGQHAATISEISPSESWQDALLALSYQVLLSYYQSCAQLPDDDPELIRILSESSRQLGYYIFHQDWK